MADDPAYTSGNKNYSQEEDRRNQQQQQHRQYPTNSRGSGGSNNNNRGSSNSSYNYRNRYGGGRGSQQQCHLDASPRNEKNDQHKYEDGYKEDSGSSMYIPQGGGIGSEFVMSIQQQQQKRNQQGIDFKASQQQPSSSSSNRRGRGGNVRPQANTNDTNDSKGSHRNNQRPNSHSNVGNSPLTHTNRRSGNSKSSHNKNNNNNASNEDGSSSVTSSNVEHKKPKKKRNRRGGDTSSKNTEHPQKQKEPVTEEPKIDEAERLRLEEEKKKAEAERLRLEAEAEAERQHREEIERQATEVERLRLEKINKLKEATDILSSFFTTTQNHVQSRQKLLPSNLSVLRNEFVASKKKLKSDHKKCTAFCKKIKSGTWLSEDVQLKSLLKDVSSLNLSRYVEEVANALLEVKLKIADLGNVILLCNEMHQRYDDFLAILLRSLSSCLKLSQDGNMNPDRQRQRRVYFRLLVEFLLYGFMSDTKLLIKVLSEAAGAPTPFPSESTQPSNSTYVVVDANLVVSFAKAAGHEILGAPSRSVRLSMEVLKKDIDEFGYIPDQITAEEEKEELLLAHKAEKTFEQVLSALEEVAVTSDICDTLKGHCVGSYKTLCATYIATYAKHHKLEKRCEQDRLLAGSLTEAREKGLNDARKLLDNLKKSLETLSEVMDLDMPDTPNLSDDQNELGDGVAGSNPSTGGLELWTTGKEEDGLSSSLGPFDDEEIRSFYCELPDLLSTVPPTLLGMTVQEVEDKKALNIQRFGNGFDNSAEEDVVEDDSVAIETSSTGVNFNSSTGDEEVVVENMTNQDYSLDKEDESEVSTSTNKEETPHYNLTLLLEVELPECNRREKTDEIAEKFTMNHGASKKSRLRLSKSLFLVPRTRLDLLPYYARVCAILDRVFSDIAPSLLQDLEQQFHGLAKFKKNSNLEQRLKNARFLSEMTKFCVSPPIVVLRCIQRCLADFTGFNIDVSCCLLESCGRYLFRLGPLTRTRISNFMETMMRIRKAKNLDDRSVALIESAIFMVSPPPSPTVRRIEKQLPPLEAYLKYLLMVKLNDVVSNNASMARTSGKKGSKSSSGTPTTSLSFIVKQIQRLPWNDPAQDCGAMLTKYMLKACRKGRYQTVGTIADVAAALKRFKPEIPTRLIDGVVEETQWTMENPNLRDQQRVLVLVRLLGALHTSNLIPTSLVFDQLYLFINFGHEIPSELREVSEKLIEEGGIGVAVTSTSVSMKSGVSQTILEEEELDQESDDENKEEQAPAPVAVSRHSRYDPRVPSSYDPPNSVLRIKLVCTLLESVAKNVVLRSNLPKLQRFLTSFQRYLYTKQTLPVDVEFAVLDVMDTLDSSHHEQESLKRGETNGGKNSSSKKKEAAFIRYNTWLEAHNVTVAAEEAEEIAEARAKAKLLLLGGNTDTHSATSQNDAMLEEVDEEEDTDDDEGSECDRTFHSGSKEDLDPEETQNAEEDSILDSSTESDHDSSEDDDDDSDGEDDSDDIDEDDDIGEGEDARTRRLEEDAFEREIRKITMEALEKGKIAARTGCGGKVADTMVHASQFVGKKVVDFTNSATTSTAPTSESNPGASCLTLGGMTGVNFKLLKRGHKGKVEAKYFAVPSDTNLARVATKQDDEAAKERDILKARVLQYEAESTVVDGDVYMVDSTIGHERMQQRNRPLSMEDIDRNFSGTSGYTDRRSTPGRGGRGSTRSLRTW